MNKIGVIANAEKDPDFKFAKKLMNWLIDNGADPFFMSEHENAAFAEGQFDFLICLGGDGTLLRAAGSAAVRGVPLIGVNLGNMGYLTDVAGENAEAALQKVLHGKYKLERRMMLNADLAAYDIPVVNPALNEVCVATGVHSNMIRIKIWINGEYTDACRSDGIIIATPTGSTAYNLSAGGPILKPDANMIAVTPICSHALHTRPFVISADDAVCVQVEECRSADVTLLMDGKIILSLKDGDKIVVTRSKYTTGIIKTNDLGFYDILRQKMSV